MKTAISLKKTDKELVFFKLLHQKKLVPNFPKVFNSLQCPLRLYLQLQLLQPEPKQFHQQ